MTAALPFEAEQKPGKPMTAAAVKDALHRRYNQPSQGHEGERYICLEEARSGAGSDGNRGQCDFLAINTWQGRGMELIGHEVKVSMSDWKRELAQPHKAEVFARFCRRWYVAAPSDLASKIRHEVPPAWGLLSISDAGRVTETSKPQPRRTVEDVPVWWWIGWLAQIDRQHKRRLPHLIQQGMADEREHLAEQITKDVERRHRYTLDQFRAKADRLDKLSEATGIDLNRRWIDVDRLREGLAIAEAVWPGLPKTLRKAADALDATARGAQP